MTTLLEYVVSNIEEDVNKDRSLLTNKEWFTEKNPKYPVTVDFVLRRKSNIEKIQITCHNSFIPDRLQLLAKTETEYKHLGDVQFKKKKSSQTKHEVKTIYLDEICTELRFRFLGCHDSPDDNPAKQVGLMEVKMFGQTVPDAEEHTLFDPIEDKPEVVVVKDQKYTKEIEQITQNVERNKTKYVMQENFQLAKQAQLAQRLLAKAKTEMTELERDKNEAIEEEDYQRALDLAEEMKALRTHVLAAIDARLVEESPNDLPKQQEQEIYKPKNLFDEDPVEELPRKPRLFTPVDLSPTRVQASADVNYLLPPRPPSSRSSNRSKEESRPTRQRTANRPSSKDSINAEGSLSRRRSSDSSITARPSSVESNTSVASIETLKVHKTRRSLSRGSSVTNRVTNKFMEKENMIVPAAMKSRPAPDLPDSPTQNEEKTVESEDEFMLSVPPNERAGAAKAVSSFGLKTMTNIFSKNWEKRRRGIEEVRSKMDSVSSKKAKDHLESAIFILARITKDSLYNVYSAGLGLLTYLTGDFMPRHQLMKTAPSLASATHEQLTIKAGENTNDKRITKETKDAMGKILKSDERLCKAYISRILSNSSVKSERGRCQIVQIAVDHYDVPRESAGLTEEPLRVWAVNCMKHTDAEVRNTGKRVFLRLYQRGDRASRVASRAALPATAKNLVFKTLLEEMNAIDQSKY